MFFLICFLESVRGIRNYKFITFDRAISDLDFDNNTLLFSFIIHPDDKVLPTDIKFDDPSRHSGVGLRDTPDIPFLYHSSRGDRRVTSYINIPDLLGKCVFQISKWCNDTFHRIWPPRPYAPSRASTRGFFYWINVFTDFCYYRLTDFYFNVMFKSDLSVVRLFIRSVATFFNCGTCDLTEIRDVGYNVMYESLNLEEMSLEEIISRKLESVRYVQRNYEYIITHFDYNNSCPVSLSDLGDIELLKEVFSFVKHQPFYLLNSYPHHPYMQELCERVQVLHCLDAAFGLSNSIAACFRGYPRYICSYNFGPIYGKCNDLINPISLVVAQEVVGIDSFIHPLLSVPAHYRKQYMILFYEQYLQNLVNGNVNPGNLTLHQVYQQRELLRYVDLSVSITNLSNFFSTTINMFKTRGPRIIDVSGFSINGIDGNDDKKRLDDTPFGLSGMYDTNDLAVCNIEQNITKMGPCAPLPNINGPNDRMDDVSNIVGRRGNLYVGRKRRFGSDGISDKVLKNQRSHSMNDIGKNKTSKDKKIKKKLKRKLKRKKKSFSFKFDGGLYDDEYFDVSRDRVRNLYLPLRDGEMDVVGNQPISITKGMTLLDFPRIPWTLSTCVVEFVIDPAFESQNVEYLDRSEVHKLNFPHYLTIGDNRIYNHPWGNLHNNEAFNELLQSTYSNYPDTPTLPGLPILPGMPHGHYPYSSSLGGQVTRVPNYRQGGVRRFVSAQSGTDGNNNITINRNNMVVGDLGSDNDEDDEKVPDMFIPFRFNTVRGRQQTLIPRDFFGDEYLIDDDDNVTDIIELYSQNDTSAAAVGDENESVLSEFRSRVDREYEMERCLNRDLQYDPSLNPNAGSVLPLIHYEPSVPTVFEDTSDDELNSSGVTTTVVIDSAENSRDSENDPIIPYVIYIYLFYFLFFIFIFNFLVGV